MDTNRTIGKVLSFLFVLLFWGGIYVFLSWPGFIAALVIAIVGTSIVYFHLDRQVTK